MCSSDLGEGKPGDQPLNLFGGKLIGPSLADHDQFRRLPAWRIENPSLAYSDGLLQPLMQDRPAQQRDDPLKLGVGEIAQQQNGLMQVRRTRQCS